MNLTYRFLFRFKLNHAVLNVIIETAENLFWLLVFLDKLSTEKIYIECQQKYKKKCFLGALTQTNSDWISVVNKECWSIGF